MRLGAERIQERNEIHAALVLRSLPKSRFLIALA
jgi:hypothetical protein